MKKLLLAVCLAFSGSAFAAEPPSTAPNADIPGTLVPPTPKQLKSVKKPKKEKAVKPCPPPEDDAAPAEAAPSH